MLSANNPEGVVDRAIVKVKKRIELAAFCENNEQVRNVYEPTAKINVLVGVCRLVQIQCGPRVKRALSLEYLGKVLAYSRAGSLDPIVNQRGEAQCTDEGNGASQHGISCPCSFDKIHDDGVAQIERIGQDTEKAHEGQVQETHRP